MVRSTNETEWEDKEGAPHPCLAHPLLASRYAPQEPCIPCPYGPWSLSSSSSQTSQDQTTGHRGTSRALRVLRLLALPHGFGGEADPRVDFMETWDPREEQRFDTLGGGGLDCLVQRKRLGTWDLLVCPLALVKVMRKLHLLYELAIPLLSIYPRKMRAYVWK